MPAYNFQEQFVEKYEQGTKIHTIRKRRKHPTKVGDRLFLKTGMRTKHCREFGQETCKDIQPVQIYPERGQVVLNGRPLGWEEIVSLSYHDGFVLPGDFFAFFKRYPLEVLENELEVIYWR